MFKVMYVRTRDNLPYLHTYRSNDQRTEFEYDEAADIALRVERQRSNFSGTRVGVVPADQDCPDWCPWCGKNLKAEGFPLGHQMDDSNECPLKIRD
jgi:hypothetical protein